MGEDNGGDSGIQEAQEGVELQAEEETESQKVITTPCAPTPAQIEEHRIDHLPFRSWCRECVEGRGREAPHHPSKGERDISTISFDYFGITKQGTFPRKDWGLLDGLVTEGIVSA